MKKRLIDVDENTGIKNYFIKDRTGKIVVEQHQDTKEHVKHIKEMQKVSRENPSSSLKPLATIPAIFKEMWDKELGDDCFKKEHKEFLFMKLNSPEFSALKYNRGKI